MRLLVVWCTYTLLVWLPVTKINWLLGWDNPETSVPSGLHVTYFTTGIASWSPQADILQCVQNRKVHWCAARIYRATSHGQNKIIHHSMKALMVKMFAAAICVIFALSATFLWFFPFFKKTENRYETKQLQYVTCGFFPSMWVLHFFFKTWKIRTIVCQKGSISNRKSSYR